MLDLGTEGSVSTIYPDAPRFWELHLFFFFWNACGSRGHGYHVEHMLRMQIPGTGAVIDDVCLNVLIGESSRSGWYRYFACKYRRSSPTGPCHISLVSLVDSCWDRRPERPY